MTEPQFKPCPTPDAPCTIRKGYLCTSKGVVACGPATIPGLLPPTGEVEDLETDEARADRLNREYERATPSRKANPMRARHIDRTAITEEVVTGASRTFISTIRALNRNIREEPVPVKAGGE